MGLVEVNIIDHETGEVFERHDIIKAIGNDGSFGVVLIARDGSTCVVKKTMSQVKDWFAKADSKEGLPD